jgi:peptidoglycan/xylan/chitin deacetylase (PgdA/CDA1 family)
MKKYGMRGIIMGMLLLVSWQCPVYATEQASVEQTSEVASTAEALSSETEIGSTGESSEATTSTETTTEITTEVIATTEAVVTTEAVETTEAATTEKKTKKKKTDIDPKKKMVALTFDDGPGKYTMEIVKCLKKNNARATFFVLGCNVDAYGDAVKAAYKIGCEIGSHTYNHSNLTRLSTAEIKKQMKDTDKKIKKLIGKKATLMRTPGGNTNEKVQKAVGKPIILWSIDTLDWKTRSKEKTIQAVMNNVQDGDIVLMHDIHEPSKEAALVLIRKLKQKGYQLVTVSELAEYRGYKLKKGTVYHRFIRKKSK